MPVGNRTVGEEELSANVIKVAKDWALQFQEAADLYELSLLGVEMALIADERRQSTGQAPFFTGYVTMFSAEADGLHAAYADCIFRSQNLGVKGGTPIALHKDLYGPSTGFYHKAIPGPRIAQPDSEFQPVLRAYGFRMGGRESGGRARHVSRQMDDVVQVLTASAKDRNILDQVSGGTLVLIPFARPEFAQSSKVNTKPGYIGTPGGCIFFIFRESVRSGDIKLRSFLRDVRWILAEASAAESQTAYEAAARQRDFAGAMFHGSVSAIRAIHTSTLIDLLIYKDAHRKLFSARDIIADFAGEADVVIGHKGNVARKLRSMMIAENVATSLIGFSEMYAAEGGVVRDKFRSEDPWSIRSVVEETWKLSRRAEDGSQPLAAGDSDDATADWDLPSGYLREDLITGVLLELFRNAIEHGRAANQDGRPIRLSIFGGPDDLTVQIENDLADGGPPPGGLPPRKVSENSGFRKSHPRTVR